MLIQNTSNLAPTSARLVSNDEPVGVAAQPGASVEAPHVAATQAAAQQPTFAQLANEVGKINKALQQTNKNLELSFTVDKSTNKQVVKLLDKETGDTLLQYPTETVLAISRGIDQYQQGLLLRQKA